MSENQKTTQQELMKKFLEEKNKKNSQVSQGVLRPGKGSSKTNTKANKSNNGGGFFDK